MTESPAPRGRSAQKAHSLFEAKIAAELLAADGLLPGSDRVESSGDLFARILLVKGEPGPAEETGDQALSGPDGEAAAKALEALGFDADSVFATLSRERPEADANAVADRLLLQFEAIDPTALVALDAVAAADIASACGLSRLMPGVPARWRGRTVLAIDGLEASLVDPSGKRRVWKQLRSLKPPGPVW